MNNPIRFTQYSPLRSMRIPALLLALWTPGLAPAQSLPQTLRSTVDQYVETRRISSEEDEQWRQEKQNLLQLSELLKQEKLVLSERIQAAQQGAGGNEREREELQKRNQELQEIQGISQQTLERLEQRVLLLSKRFPQSLNQTLSPLLQRIPSPEKNSRLSVSLRLQNLVGILNEADKFNATLSVIPEIRTLPDNTEMQVQTLYLGLAQAYFVDTTGKVAGWGIPGNEGWNWTLEPSLAAQIQVAIDCYQAKRIAEFVTLPARIQ